MDKKRASRWILGLVAVVALILLVIQLRWSPWRQQQPQKVIACENDNRPTPHERAGPGKEDDSTLEGLEHFPTTRPSRSPRRLSARPLRQTLQASPASSSPRM